MRVRLLLALLVSFVACFVALAQDKPQPAPKAEDKPAETAPERNPEAKWPTRPEKGPGSAEYAHKSVEVAEAGEGGKHYWVYTPAEPAPKDAPVVCFIHGFGALKPEPYLGWLKHICLRGNIVVYPQYQANAFEPAVNYAPNCAESVLAAIKWLKDDPKRVQPCEKDFAIVGHSAGGVAAGNVAADWETLKLPKPKAAMPVQPGRAFSYKSDAQKEGLIPLSDYAKIPESCLLLCVYGDSDTTVGSWCAKKIFADAKVKPENKNLCEVRSSTWCAKPAIAHHRTPGCPEGTDDVFDWYAYWKLFDGLCDAAFAGKNRQYALGNTQQQRFMGKCSDGHPFTEVKVTLGDAKIDPDEAYTPAFKADGSKFPAEKPTPKGEKGAPKETPKEGDRAPEKEKPRDDKPKD